jgi:hypothetical protein
MEFQRSWSATYGLTIATLAFMAGLAVHPSGLSTTFTAASLTGRVTKKTRDAPGPGRCFAGSKLNELQNILDLYSNNGKLFGIA